MPKTKLTPKFPWNRAPLGPFERVLYEHIAERMKDSPFPPTAIEMAKQFGCRQFTVESTVRSLIAKGWLGEAGERRTEIYLNDKPDDLDD